MDIKKIIMEMTLEEKAGMCSGADFWHTKAVERLGIPAVMVSDGPHGLRKQAGEGDHLGINDSIKAVCFPAGCALASSFDRELVRQVGETLGNECQAENVGVILGPAANIKRSPLCGRNFEYYSEDPYLAGEVAVSQIEGVQSQNVGTSMKHFFANNQEHRRMSSSSEMDERTAREIYLSAFETAVTKAQPWTIMNSYNQVNGTYVAQSKRYLTDILRGEWGFKGFVVSDWGAVNNRVPDLDAGLDLEMPASNGVNDRRIVEAVKSGSLKEDILDQAVERILRVIDQYESKKNLSAVFDRDCDHEMACKASGECSVLLKNSGALPLLEKEEVVFIGEFAKMPRFQGGGSSHINAHKTESAWDAVNHGQVQYARGYDTKCADHKDDYIQEAVNKAKTARKAVIFAGLPDAYESEGFDRKHLRMPAEQNELITAVAAVNSNTVVVLHNGAPVEMPWIEQVNAVLEVYLGGQAVGRATAELLYGKINPSGKLAETFPLRLEDTPSYLYYLGEGDKVEYREGVFVGYRYYDKKKMPVLFPFGHGLSYTTFAYDNLQTDKKIISEKDSVQVTVDVINTGDRAGKEVVELYVEPIDSNVIRPVRELKGFDKIELQPGEKKTVSFTLDARSFAYFDMELNNWYVESIDYKIAVGTSSRELAVEELIHVNNQHPKKVHVTMDTIMGDILTIEGAARIMQPMLEASSILAQDSGDDVLGEGTGAMMEAMMHDLPLHAMLSFGGGTVTWEELEQLADKLNGLQEENMI